VNPVVRRWLAPAALVLALVSLASNVVLLRELRSPGRLLAPVVERSFQRMVERDVTLKVEVRVPAGTPLHMDIPVDQHYRVRLHTTLPVNTTIQLPVATPFGTRTFDVPVRTSIPIRTDLPVHLRDTFRLRSETRAEIVLPVQVPLRELPLDEVLRSLRP
jgi:hypothetical protein